MMSMLSHLEEEVVPNTNMIDENFWELILLNELIVHRREVSVIKLLKLHWVRYKTLREETIQDRLNYLEVRTTYLLFIRSSRSSHVICREEFHLQRKIFVQFTNKM